MTGPRLARRCEALGGTGAEAWEIHGRGQAAAARGEDVIVLSVGDPESDAPIAAVDAAVDALRSGDHHYTPIAGRAALRSAIAEHVGAQVGVEIDPDEVMSFAGTQNALFAAVQVLFDPGDEVLVADPAYVTYAATLGAAGAVAVPVAPLDGFRPDLAAIEAAVTDRTRGLMFASPANPTGVCLDDDELDALADLARRHDLWVVADEVYADLVFDGPHRSIRTRPGLTERTVLTGSVSKSHAMTGWRAGWAVAPRPVVRQLGLLGLAMLYGLPGFVQEGAVAALTEAGSTPATMRDRYRRRRDLVVSRLEGLADDGLPIRVLTPAAGMFVMVDVSGLAPALVGVETKRPGSASAAFAESLFTGAAVSVLDGGAFGEAADGWVRVSLCVDDERLAEAVDRIVDHVRRLAA